MNDFAVLNTGRKMPLIGLGTWKSEPGKVEAAPSPLVYSKEKSFICFHSSVLLHSSFCF